MNLGGIHHSLLQKERVKHTVVFFWVNRFSAGSSPPPSRPIPSLVPVSPVLLTGLAPDIFGETVTGFTSRIKSISQGLVTASGLAVCAAAVMSLVSLPHDLFAQIVFVMPDLK
ncbi:hypothetical protein E1301_Tti006734 [Triplophysa tibetana]|uniref:Uncharacterized protein n=1 Tax=Triplophysa tibetana TaxID=1572043 RepID=A0A5A9N3B7_9TELE|nr:hypothetical protein E1301_Tti006734 [Triplophysa tibetana]